MLDWFPDRRGLASGLVIAGFGSGALAFTPLVQNLCGRWEISYKEVSQHLPWSGLLHLHVFLDLILQPASDLAVNCWQVWEESSMRC